MSPPGPFRWAFLCHQLGDLKGESSAQHGSLPGATRKLLPYQRDSQAVHHGRKVTTFWITQLETADAGYRVEIAQQQLRYSNVRTTLGYVHFRGGVTQQAMASDRAPAKARVSGRKYYC